MIRYILIGIGIFALIPIAWFAWWLLNPLFSDMVVEEDFPIPARAAVPDGMTLEDFPNAARAMVPEDMTLEEVEVQMGVAAALDDPEVSEGMPAMSPSVAVNAVKAAGDFRDADSFHKGSGNAVIYQIAPGQRILRLEDFMVTNGPDLRVLLVNAPNPEGHSDLSDAGYVELGKLKGNIGSQNYDIPADFDLAEAQSVVIYCYPFRVVFSVATLETTEG